MVGGPMLDFICDTKTAVTIELTRMTNSETFTREILWSLRSTKKKLKIIPVTRILEIPNFFEFLLFFVHFFLTLKRTLVISNAL